MESGEVEWEGCWCLEGEDGCFGEVEGAAEGAECGAGVADAVQEEEDVGRWACACCGGVWGGD